MKELIIYVHGKGGSVEEADHYKMLFPNSDVIGFDYKSQTPWEAKKEFCAFFAKYRKMYKNLTLVANSIGAFFSLSSLDETLVDRAYFCNMMLLSNVTEEELSKKGKIPTDFEETLSWELCIIIQLFGLSLPLFYTVNTTV